MKKNIKLLILLSFILLLTGCFKSEELDNAEIYVTTYPIEYLAKELYGYNSEIKSIYPDGIDINEYELSNNKIKKYSKGDLFIYNGLTDEKKITANFLNKNKNLKIIDASEETSASIKYSYEELWLNPIIYSKLAQNIKDGLIINIQSTVIKDEITANYELIKETLTEFEMDLKLISQNCKSNVIIVSKNYFKFLENYGFDVISLENTEELNNDTINRAKKLLSNKENNYIFITEKEENNLPDTIKEVLKSGGNTIKLNTLTNLTSEQREKNENYITLMKENIESLKKEVFE